MTSAPLEGELRRYISHLQLQMLSHGSEDVHDPVVFSAWRKANREKLIQTARFAGGTAEMVDLISVQADRHLAPSKLESFSAHAIFGPILETVLSASERLTLRPRRPVLHANSTDIGASPSVLPSPVAEHLIFAGAGTFSFCNYWAKVVTHIAQQFHAHHGSAAMTQDRLLASCARDHRHFLEACKLTAYCRTTGSAVGFGVMPSTAEAASFRMTLVRAMELFAVAHEVGHCYLEERADSSSAFAISDEFTCDAYALTVSRSVANASNDWCAFTGAGGLLLLTLAGICFPERQSAGIHSSHPTIVSRVENLRRLIENNTATDQLEPTLSYLLDLGVICAVIGFLCDQVDWQRMSPGSGIDR
jgi:hypothetical protein